MQPIRCYSTKFEPPKKEQRNKQQLSENIKKFLAKKEAEERQKLEEKAKKRDELLALRARVSSIINYLTENKLKLLNLG